MGVEKGSTKSCMARCRAAQNSNQVTISDNLELGLECRHPCDMIG